MEVSAQTPALFLAGQDQSFESGLELLDELSGLDDGPEVSREIGQQSLVAPTQP